MEFQSRDCTKKNETGQIKMPITKNPQFYAKKRKIQAVSIINVIGRLT